MGKEKRKIGVHLTLDKCQKRNLKLESDFLRTQNEKFNIEAQLNALKREKEKYRWKIAVISDNFMKSENYPSETIEYFKKHNISFRLEYIG